MKAMQILLFGIMLLAACNRPKLRKNEINKIELSTSGGIYHYPIIAISIDSSLTLKYYGGYRAELQSYHKGEITQTFWDTLNMKLESIHYKQLDTSKYKSAIMDGKIVLATINWKGNSLHLIRPIDNQDSVSKVFIWILNKYKTLQLHKLNDSIQFDVPILNPPTLSKRKIKFPLKE